MAPFTGEKTSPPLGFTAYVFPKYPLDIVGSSIFSWTIYAPWAGADKATSFITVLFTSSSLSSSSGQVHLVNITVTNVVTAANATAPNAK